MVKPSYTSPFPTEVQAGQKYFWCTCGLSAGQPFCDGSHKGSGLKSLLLEASESKTVWFCGCKETKNPPFCDGSHEKVKVA